jgi:hypothetical protein
MLSGVRGAALYSASADWTYSGIQLFFDGGRVETLVFYD